MRLPQHKWPKSWSSMEDPVVPLERNLYGHPLAGLLWERQYEKILLQHGWQKVSNWECLFVHRGKGLFLSVYVDDIKLAGKKQNIDPMWKVLNKEVDLGEPTSFLDYVYLGCTQRQFEISKDIVDNYRTMFEWGTEKLPSSENIRTSSWSYYMEGHAKKCVERYCELANKTTQQFYKVSTPCIDDHHFKEEELKSVGELSKVCSKIVLKCLYLARIGRPDIPWSVNKLARSIAKWTKACDKRLNRLISYIHHTCEYKQYCYVCNTAKQSRLGLFQDSDFAGDLEDSKSTSGGTLCVFGSHTFVPISWMCKKQTSVSRSSTESEIISLDAGLRLDGIPALDLWDLIVLVLGNMVQTPERPGRPVVNDKEQRSQGITNVLNHMDCVPSNVQSSHQEALLYVFDDNEAVIKMIIKGRSPTMRHVSRTHRVALDWLFDRINLDPKIQIKSVDTKNQLADILTKGNFTRDEWNHLLCLFNISHFSSTVCSEAMAKRVQQDSGEERVTAKSRPMMSLIARAPSTLSSLASESPGKKSYESQSTWSAKAEENDRTEQPVVYPQRETRPQQFIIGNDETESELSLGSRSFLSRVNDQVRKRQKRSSMNVTENDEKHSMTWGKFMSVTLESAEFRGKNYLDNCHSITNTKDLTLRQMFDISTRLVSEQDEISGLETIGWENH